MEIITSREFRANQGKYLKQVSIGQDLIIKSRNFGSFKLVPISKDDTLIDEKALLAKIHKAIEDFNNGNVYEMNPDEKLEDFLDRIEL